MFQYFSINSTYTPLTQTTQNVYAILFYNYTTDYFIIITTYTLKFPSMLFSTNINYFDSRTNN